MGKSMDYEAQRVKMVNNQVRTTDVTSHSVLSAFLSVPRENYVPEAVKPLAYVDKDLEIAPGRYLTHASPVAKLLQLAAIAQQDSVLEIGSGTGYVTALLSLLAGKVVGVESDPSLAEAARANLAGATHVKILTGDMEKGAAGDGPYDVIFLNGAVVEVPDALFQQLKDGGRLIAVIGYGNASRAHVFVREKGVIGGTAEFNTAVKPLPGFRKVAEFQF